MVIGYKELVHKGGGAKDFGVKADEKKLTRGENVVFLKDGSVEIEEDLTKRNYLHLKSGTLGGRFRCWVIFKMKNETNLIYMKKLWLDILNIVCEERRLILPLSVLLSILGLTAAAQTIPLKGDRLQAVGVTMFAQKMDGKDVVLVVKDSAVQGVDEPTFVKVAGSSFKDGTIEVNVLSKLRPDAPADARGFIGLAFRINETNSKFESIYIRPTNGRADDQIRRNHSVQYFSYPDFKFFRLRKEFPEKYESYADMGLNEWIKMRIVVSGSQAKLYLNENKEPSLIVNDLKLGSEASGAIGLFVDIGTEGYFSDLKISK